MKKSSERNDMKNSEFKEIKIEDIETEEEKELRLYDMETKKLLDDKEDKIKTKLVKLSEGIGNLYDIVYYGKSNNLDSKSNNTSENKEVNEQKNNVEENSETYKLCGKKCLKVYLFGLLFFIFYLTGFFQLLDLFDACEEELGIVFHSFFYNQKRESDETFVEIYLNCCLKTIPEFDLAFLTSIIGIFPLESCGFFITSIIFFVVNLILFVGFTKIDFEKEKFDVIDFLYILFYFILFFITFGSISLIAHQKFSEGILAFDKLKEKFEEKQKNVEEKKEEKSHEIIEIRIENIEEQKGDNADKKEKEIEEVKVENQYSKNNKNKKNEKNENDPRFIDVKGCWKDGGLFFLLCIGLMLAYILNRGINIIIYTSSEQFYEDHFIAIFFFIYIGCYIISLIFYLFFNIEIIIINNQMPKNEKKDQNYFRIFGYLIYYENIPVKNSKKDLEEKNDSNQQNIIKNENNVVVYPNNLHDMIVSKKEKENNQNPDYSYYKDILYGLLFPSCYNKAEEMNQKSKYCCASCKLGFRKCYFKSKKTEFEPICCECWKCEECCSCCEECQCCLCCKRMELKETYQKEEVFCYIYKIQRKCSWFCDLFFERNMFSLIVHNIVVEMGIIGFEKKMNENLEEKSLSDNYSTIIVYLIFFLVLTILNTGWCVCLTKAKNYSGFSAFSIFFHFLNVIFSGLSYFGKGITKERTNNWVILIPIAYTKFLNFVVYEILVDSLDENNIDILSNSFVMTSVYYIYDNIVFIIADLIDADSDKLILFQFIFGILVMIFFLNLKCKSIYKEDLKEEVKKETKEKQIQVVNSEY